jgi:ParB/RepB/Spo0J family partition protein
MALSLYEQTFIPRNQIGVDPLKNARRTMYKAPLEELAASIRDIGLLQPIGVRPYDDDRYLVVWGYRRLAALDMIGAPLIPCMVVPVDDARAFEMMLAENTHREDVAPWDLGQAVLDLQKQGHNLSEVSVRLSLALGKSMKMSRLAKLSSTCQALHPDLLAVWKKNTSDFNEAEAIRVAQLSQMEQEQYLIDLCAGEAPNRAPPPGGGEPGKKRGKGRPTVRTIELAYASLKQDDRDDHEDGLENDDERKALRLTLQWILGGRARCPIRLRKKSKKKGKKSKGASEPVVDHDYTESVPAPRAPTRVTIPR